MITATQYARRTLAIAAIAFAAATTSAAAAQQDTGVYACHALSEEHQAGNIYWAIMSDVRYGLRWSGNRTLRDAGAELDRIASLGERDRVVAVNHMATLIGRLAEGCAAVGAPLLPAIVRTGAGPV